MVFAIVSKDSILREKMFFIIYIKIFLKRYFKDREYGQGVKEIYIGLLSSDSCPDDVPIENFLEKKYYKKRKELEYDIILDYQTIVKDDRIEKQAYLIKEVLASLEPIFTELKIPNFNLNAFKQDLQTALEMISPDFVGIFGDLSKTYADELDKIFDKYIKEHSVKKVKEEVVVHEEKIDKKAKQKKKQIGSRQQ